MFLRTGLCFLCQRNVNDQRRADRKRVGVNPEQPSEQPNLICCLGPKPKRFKIGKSPILLQQDAIIINGTVKGTTRRQGEGYGVEEIGNDLLSSVHDAYEDAARLIQSVSGDPQTMAAAAVAALSDESPNDANALYAKTFQSLSKTLVLLSQWKSAYDNTATALPQATEISDAVASAAAVAAYNEQPLVSLLLAADQRHDLDDIIDEAERRLPPFMG